MSELTPWKNSILIPSIVDSVVSPYVNNFEIIVTGNFISSTLNPAPLGGYTLLPGAIPGVTPYTLTINPPARNWRYTLQITTDANIVTYTIDTDCIEIWDNTFTANYVRSITLLGALSLGSDTVTPAPTNGYSFTLIDPINLIYSFTINAISNNPNTLYTLNFSVPLLGSFSYYIVPDQVRLPNWTNNDSSNYVLTDINIYYPLDDPPTISPVVPFSFVPNGIIPPAFQPLIDTANLNIQQTSSIVTYIINTDNPTPANVFYYVDALQCIGYDSMITLANGEKKAVQDINRGDDVLGLNNKIHKVTRIIRSEVFPQSMLDLCIFPKGVIGNSEELIMTQDHPIYHDKNRYLAKGFGYKKSMLAKDALKADPEGKYYLYDLQFETLGCYFANEIPIQSRSPRSKNTPLPRDLYFDQSLYSEDRYDDFEPGYEYSLIL